MLDKGAAALANTLELEQAGLGWITALPWNQAPAELRQRPCEELTPLGSAQPGVRAAAERALVHGKEYLCVVKYWPGLSMEELIEQLRQIQQFQLLYPPQGKKGPPRAATILSKQTLPQQSLAQALELDQLTASQRS